MRNNIPEEKNLHVWRKTSKAYELQFTKNNRAIDITGWTIYFTVKSKKSDTDGEALIQKDVTSHSDPTQGITLISLSATETDIIGSKYYDIKIKDDEGNSNIILQGRILFSEVVTQRG